MRKRACARARAQSAPTPARARVATIARTFTIEPSGPRMASAGAWIDVKAQMKAQRTFMPTAATPVV